jgi:putative zinc finger/helix-turn-helix YgiT family protein
MTTAPVARRVETAAQLTPFEIAMQKPIHHATSDDAPVRLTECLECGSTALEERFDEETFQYGGREKPFTVIARIPSLLCTACGVRFYDDAAVWARHAAACRHLGVMIPDEILALRERYGLTQEALAALTGIGVASLGRWERGAGIQNEGYDALLYLLRFPENVERLRHRRAGDADPPPPTRHNRMIKPRHNTPEACDALAVQGAGFDPFSRN